MGGARQQSDGNSGKRAILYILDNPCLTAKLATRIMIYNGRLITAVWGTLDFLKIF